MAEPHVRFLQQLKDRSYELGVIYDIGANIGRWSVEARSVFPDARLELFEPLVGKVQAVDEAGQFHLLPDHGLHPVALSNENKTGTIKLLDDLGVGSSILILDADKRRGLTFIEVEFARLDDLVAQKGLPQPDLLKLDTQAAELKVLQGATNTLKQAKFVLAEVWMRRVYGPETPLFHELASFLYDQGYVPYEFLSLDDGRDADGTLRWFDAVFINKSASRFTPNML